MSKTLWVVRAERAVRQGRDWTELSLRDTDGALYGPLQLNTRHLWVSKHPFLPSEVNNALTRTHAIVGNNRANTVSYGARRSVIWAYSETKENDSLLQGNYEHVGLTARLTNNIPHPYPAIIADDTLFDILKQQTRLHERLRSLYTTALLPLLAHGMSLADTLRWLGKKEKTRESLEHIRKDRNTRIASYARVPDKNFFFDTAPLIKEIEVHAETLEQQLIAYAPNSVLLRPWHDADTDRPLTSALCLSDPYRVKMQGADATIVRNILTTTLTAFDIEVMHWWTDKPIIYAISIANDGPVGNHLYTIFDTGTSVMHSKTGRTAVIHTYKPTSANYNDLCFASAHMLADAAVTLSKSVGRISHNGLGYDYPQLARLQKFFSIGTDNNTPRNVAFRLDHMADYGRKRSPDAIDLDTQFLARYTFMDFLCDAKLETLSRMCDQLLGTQLKFAKMLTYAKLDDLVEAAARGDSQAASIIAQYSMEDAITNLVIAQPLFKTRLEIAETLQIPLFDVLHETPKNIALITGEKTRWEQLHVPTSPVDSARYDKSEFDSMVSSRLRQKELHRGLHRDVLIAHMPIATRLGSILGADPRKRALLTALTALKTPIEAYTHARIAQAWVGELMSDIIYASKKDTPAVYGNVLLAKYNVPIGSGTPDQRLAEAVHNAFQSFHDCLDSAQILNASETLIFLKDMPAEDAVRQGLIVVGRGDMLSIAAGVTLYRIGDQFYKTGIDIPSEKQAHEEPGQNKRCAYAISALRTLATNIFSDPIEALETVAIKATKLRNHEVPLNQLVQRIVKRNNPENLSVNQQNTRRANVLRTIGTNIPIGSNIQYIICQRGSEEYYVPFDIATGKFAETPAPAWNTYLQELFGITRVHKEHAGTYKTIKSPVLIIAEAILQPRKKQEHQRLQALLTGAGIPGEISDLALQQAKLF